MSKPTKTKERDSCRHPAHVRTRPPRKPRDGNAGVALQQQKTWERRDNPARNKS
jgi:hypothetical protein